MESSTSVSTGSGLGVGGEPASGLGKLHQTIARLEQERAVHTALLDATVEGIYSIDLDGCCTFMNRTGARLLGYEREELLGRSIHAVIHSRYPDGSPYPVAECPMSETIRTGQVTRVAGEWLWRKDGTGLPVEFTAAPIQEADRIVGAVVTFMDLTERRQAEATRHEQAAAFRRLFASNPLPMWVYDLDSLRFLEVNDAAVGQYGYTRAEFRHMRILDIRPDAELPRLFANLRAARPDWERSGAWRHRRRDGSVIDVEITSHTISFRGHQAALVVAQDVTEQVRLETERAASQRRLEEAQRVAGLGSWEVDLRHGQVTISVSDEMYHLFDLPPAADGSTVDDCLARLPAADRAYMELAVRDLLRRGGSADFEHCLPRADGPPRLLRYHAEVVADDAGAPVRLVGTAQDITERRQAEQALRESEARYRLLFEQASDAIALIDEAGRPIDVNTAALDLLGYSREELAGRSVVDLIVPEDLAQAPLRHEAWRAGEVMQRDRQLRRKDGTIITVEATTRRLDGDRTMLLCRDVTERRRLEGQLRQAQKMEAVGRLAGGVAHDYNNMLGVILGVTDLVLEGLAADDPNRPLIEQIAQAGDRAAELTRQLLAFSRKQVLQPRPLDLNAVVKQIERMLHRLLGEDLELAFVPAPALGQVHADPGQLEQVLLNLAINARDAMPRGGKLTIETTNVTLDADYARLRPEASAGDFVCLSVTDTGTGMDTGTLAQCFEPFFTTKSLGQGTGLGLATVHGIVAQSGGWINVYSEVGIGTCFKVYLPRLDAPGEARPPATTAADTPTGTETVWLVEDDAALRGLTRAMLESLGYRVVEARDGDEALLYARTHPEAVQLLLTDVVMPRLSGRELAEHLVRQRPGLKVLFMSGYTDDSVLRHGVIQAEAAFLQKPFTRGSLARKVRAVLDGAPPPTQRVD